MKVKTLWLIINIIAIGYFSYVHYTIDKDAMIPFTYIMFLTTFPIGIVFATPFYFVMEAFIGYEEVLKNYSLFIFDIFIPGILFMVGGYIQWFVIVPKMKRYFKSKNKGKT